jgi:hypothetical protein
VVPTFEYFSQIHFGDAPGSLFGVVITFRINDQTSQDFCHLAFHFQPQLINLTWLQEFGNIIVCVEASIGPLQTRPDPP